MMKIGSNQQTLQRLSGLTQNNLTKSLQKLTSGKNINSAADNAAGLAILSKMAAQISGNQQAAYNTQDSYSVAQVAEGGYTQISDIQQRLRTLAVQASNGTLSDDDRALLQMEAEQLISEIDRMSESVEFNGQKLFNGDYAIGAENFETQAGANAGEKISFNFEKINVAELGLDNFDISSSAAAQQAIQKVDDSISNISGYRAKLGAFQNRLEDTYNFTGVQRENQMNAASQIGDTDYALEMLKHTTNLLRNNINTALLAQGNLLNKNVLALIK